MRSGIYSALVRGLVARYGSCLVCRSCREIIDAEDRIGRLYALAQKRTIDKGKSSRKLARRYVHIMKRISSHYKVALPKKIKDRICRKCDNTLVPGINCTVRISAHNKYIVYRCECGNENHIFYK